MIDRVLFSSIDVNWRTPKGLYNALKKEFRFDFDPCPIKHDFDGLKCDWGRSNFINPPYNKAIIQWLNKGIEETKKNKICVFLLPSRTDTIWFHKLVIPCAKEIRFIKGRLHFNNHKNATPFPSMLVIYRPEVP